MDAPQPETGTPGVAGVHEWMYIDPNTSTAEYFSTGGIRCLFQNEQLPGGIPESEQSVLHILRSKETLMWHKGMPEWKPAFELPEWQDVAKPSPAFFRTKWYYMGEDGFEKGPLLDEDFRILFEKGSVDGLTKVTSDGETWQELAEVESLKSILTQHKSSVRLEDLDAPPSSKRSLPAVAAAAVPETPLRVLDRPAPSESDPKEEIEDETGVKFHWDSGRSQWLEGTATQKRKRPAQKKKKKKGDGWKKMKMSTWVYVEGLPKDTSVAELQALFGKCGIIRIDESMQPKIKIYRDESGACKGDASVSYLKEESVELCLTLLDKTMFKDNEISVSRAVFNRKSDESVQPKKQKLKKQVIVSKLQMKQALSWDEDNVIDFGLKIVVLMNLFSPEEFQDSLFPATFESFLQETFGKFGPIVKITVFEKNPMGVVVIKYADSKAAEECVQECHDHEFRQRKVCCEYWDGVTNYRVRQTDEEEEKKLKEFGVFLEQKSGDSSSEGDSGSETD